MQYSLDQRRYRLNLNVKQLYEECRSRGRKISYDSVRKALHEPEELVYTTVQKVADTISELESERGIKSSEQDF